MENLKLKVFLGTILEKEVPTKMFYKCVVLFLTNEGMLNTWLQIHKGFKDIVDELHEEGIITIVSERVTLNKVNFKRSKYPDLLGINDTMTFNQLLFKFKQLWSDKIGISGDQREYRLLDKARTDKALSEFTKQHKEINYEIIIEATEEYLNECERDEKDRIIFGAKSNTFITGNERKGYLIEYCTKIMQRKEMQTRLQNKDGGSHAIEMTNWKYVQL